MSECDCGAPKAARAEACDRCLALEKEQALRERRGGNRVAGESRYGKTPDYQRARRAAKVAEGFCSMCTARAADLPQYKTCGECRARVAKPNHERPQCTRSGRTRAGGEWRCKRRVGSGRKLCATHRAQAAAQNKAFHARRRAAAVEVHA